MSARSRADESFKKEAARMSFMRELKFRNDAQKDYYTTLCDKNMVFAAGPAGTGKTFIACARALELLQRKEVNKIYLVRPAVEAEEELGFLPGTVGEKLEPYLVPLHDNLRKACHNYHLLGEYLEVAPLAFLRGRTLDNCVVLVDEAQNMTPDQMLMLLTRLGRNCYCFAMGDPDQGDLEGSGDDGLTHAIKRMRNCNLVGVSEFSAKDVVRSKLVRAVYEFWFEADDDEDSVGFR